MKKAASKRNKEKKRPREERGEGVDEAHRHLSHYAFSVHRTGTTGAEQVEREREAERERETERSQKKYASMCPSVGCVRSRKVVTTDFLFLSISHAALALSLFLDVDCVFHRLHFRSLQAAGILATRQK